MILDLLAPVQAIAVDAGRAAVEFYGQDIPVEAKADDSPLTLADQASHRLITAALTALTPDIPVLSEESQDTAAISESSGDRLWVVDPLDGTKEFIKQTGQFTVNIALLEFGWPVLGVVHIPVSGVSYLGLKTDKESGAWVQLPGADREAIATREADLDHLTVVASRDHAGPVVEAFLARLKNAEKTSMGSSLKFCLVAEGKADFYPRVVPTMQWDTAAAQCIVEAAGGQVTDLSGTRLDYPKDRLRNPSILAFGDTSIDWASFFSASS
jgi:3'(2'), 5'-bisphosphate nucleotidase